MHAVAGLFSHKFVRFFVVGVAGTLLNLLTTWLLTTYVFGLAGYFKSYLIGTAVNLLFNFTLYSVAVFKTSGHTVRRFVEYAGYSIGMTALQALLIRTITPMIGLDFYLLVIVSVIALGAVLSFFVCNDALFKGSGPTSH